MGGLWSRAVDSVRHEWQEAPWFVLLMIAISAFVGPMVVFGALDALRSLF